MKPTTVKVAVKSTAIQEFNGQTVVFKRDSDHVIATPVTTGITDNNWTEITEGLKVGDKYISSHSFLAKAEILKSTAEHED